MQDSYAVVCECTWRATLDSRGGRTEALERADELAGAHLRDSPACDEPWLEVATRVALPRMARPVAA
jgi:hypothetical protein